MVLRQRSGGGFRGQVRVQQPSVWRSEGPDHEQAGKSPLARGNDGKRIQGPRRRVPGDALSAFDVPVTPLYEVAVPRESQCSPEASGEDPQGAEGEEWAIEALVIGDVSQNAKGCSLLAGKEHACGQARSGHEKFHAIDWDDQIFATRATRP